MPFYVFVRVTDHSQTWELLEASNSERIANQAFKMFKRIQKRIRGGEVVMLEADNIDAARQMLELP